MSNPGSFQGLARLARKAGLLASTAKPGANAAPPADEDDDESGNETGDETGSGNGGDEGVDAGGAPGNDGGDEGAGDEDAGEGEGEGDDGGDQGTGDDGAQANTRSADYRAGVTATNGRWAAVFSSEHARANLELATDLLADTNMTPKAIVGMCERHKPAGKSGLDRLATTPRPNLGGATAGAGGIQTGDPGQAARKSAAQRANARLGGRGVKARAAARGKQQEG